MDKYTIAKYKRLSMEDAKSDSMSLENQDAQINGFINLIPEEDIEVLDFTDNGYTGTNFERPAMQELLGLVREGKINRIIVKDFSRFGRNSVDSAYFLQKVFPLYQVRFISMSIIVVIYREK